MRLALMLLISAALLAAASCAPTGGERNPFSSYIDAFSLFEAADGTSGSAARGTAATGLEFRRAVTLTFNNFHPAGTLETTFAAWVNVSSVSTSLQQDALLRAGYVQLTAPVRLGSVFELPAGTFIYNGPGTAGATPVRLAAAGSGGAADEAGQGAETTTVVTPSSRSFVLAAPDVILVYEQPPVSCDSVAFVYRDPVTGDVLGALSTAEVSILGGGSVGFGGYKTYAQVDVYTCDPFRPGVFFAPGGRAASNTFVEGQDITFNFFAGRTAAGHFAQVQIGVVRQDDPNQP